MPLTIIRGDLTTLRVDAIVNAAKPSLLGGGGVDGCIHRAAGPELLAACRALGPCETGQAKLTPGFRLPARFVIHTVGPRWRDGQHGEGALLRSCYRSSLLLAREQGFESVAFPLISSGVYGFPKDQALKAAVDAIGDFLLENDMTVYLVIFDRAAYQIGSKLFSDITSYIDDHYVETHQDSRREQARRMALPPEDAFPSTAAPLSSPARTAPVKRSAPSGALAASLPPRHRPKAGLSLDDALRQLDESFSEMLLRKIDERGISDAACYKKANIDRKLFSKIRKDKSYRPSKTTAVALGLALELPLDELRDLLAKAGFSLTHASKFDIIVEYFVAQGNYNIFEINEALFAFDQSLIGA